MVIIAQTSNIMKIKVTFSLPTICKGGRFVVEISATVPCVWIQIAEIHANAAGKTHSDTNIEVDGR